MVADRVPVLAGVLREQRRGLVLWSIAVAAVSAIYVGFWPAMGDAGDIEAFVENMPAGLVEALGYDDIATPAGYLRSTIFGLLGPALLLVFAIGTGARLIAGGEEDGTLELELTAPVSRRRVLCERVLALWLGTAVLAAAVTLVAVALGAVVDLDVPTARVVATGLGLLLLALGFGTVALGIGAATGRRAHALAGGAGAAVAAFVLDAIGPLVGAGWMTTVSPFSWYLEPNPLAAGLGGAGLVGLLAVPLAAAGVALVMLNRRDLMV